jgi:hypothetical protein
VRRRFAATPYVIVTTGSVPDILHQVAPGFLHLDMNSPQAEAGALEVLFDRISPGVASSSSTTTDGAEFHAQKEVADHFMAERGQFIMELPTAQGLMVKR